MAVKPGFKKCPICGFQVPLDLVVAHRIYHLGSNEDAIESKESLHNMPLSDHNSHRSERITKPIPAKINSHSNSEKPSQHFIYGINKLLEDIFDHPTRPSQILRKAGISQLEIDLIRQDHLDSYLSNLVRKLLSWWQLILPPDCISTLMGAYDLTQEITRQSPAVKIQDEWPPPEVEQLRKAALLNLKKAENKARLERIILEEARAIISVEDRRQI